MHSVESTRAEEKKSWAGTSSKEQLTDRAFYVRISPAAAVYMVRAPTGMVIDDTSGYANGDTQYIVGPIESQSTTVATPFSSACQRIHHVTPPQSKKSNVVVLRQKKTVFCGDAVTNVRMNNSSRHELTRLIGPKVSYISKVKTKYRKRTQRPPKVPYPPTPGKKEPPRKIVALLR